MLYKKIVLDFETTGLDSADDEILQVTAIDQDYDVILDEYCKPKFKSTWIESQNIHGITPEMVSNKKPFEEYVDTLSDILLNAEEIIIYNVNFELSFLNKYGVKFNNNFFDLMEAFAEVCGDWNEYYGSYTWKSLYICCEYYGYQLKNAHNSLEDCRATLYCYNKLMSNSPRYCAEEYIGRTVETFVSDMLTRKTSDKVNLWICNHIEGEKHKKTYFKDFIDKIEDIECKELLNATILKVSYWYTNEYCIFVTRSLEAELYLSNEKIKLLEERLSDCRKKYQDESISNSTLKNKITKLENKYKKLKQEVGLEEAPKIPVINSYGFYTAEYCRSTKKPMIQSSQYAPFSNTLLSKSRCKKIKRPVEDNEEIYAFLRVHNGYCALYYRP